MMIDAAAHEELDARHTYAKFNTTCFMHTLINLRESERERLINFHRAARLLAPLIYSSIIGWRSISCLIKIFCTARSRRINKGAIWRENFFYSFILRLFGPILIV